MTKDYDMVVIGTGNAGLAASRLARENERSVAIVESREVGGTCPLRGCVPKKVLVAAARTLDAIAGAGIHHIDAGVQSLDWSALIRRKQSFTDGASERFEKTLAEREIDLFRGRAHFTAHDQLMVGDETLRARKIVIATGSKPRVLPVDGAEHLITSDDLLNLTELPESLIFIGGGVIAFEFAHVLARAGTRVTILEAATRVLSGMDSGAADCLRRATEAIGVDVVADADVQRIAPANSALEVRYQRDGQSRAITVERVANGAGRVPDVEDLDLDAGGIDHEGNAITHTPGLQSVSNARVYVAGDSVADSPQLSPLATYEGRIAAGNAVHGTDRAPDYLSVPAVVFTLPALASVGRTESAAHDAGLRFEARQSDPSEWLSSKLHGHRDAYARVLVEHDSDRILGAHLVGAEAAELIHIFALAMRSSTTATDLDDMTFAFPTSSSEVPSML